MGLSDQPGPSHVIPTVLYRSDREESSEYCRRGVFPVITSHSQQPLMTIGNSAVKESVALDASGFTKPIQDGRVHDWSDLEQFIHGCYGKYLKIHPSDHACILTEPPLNPARNRERLAETMFETFGVPSMYIGVQAVMALYAYEDGKGSLTGTVIDSGDGVTHVIPVTDGYVVGAAEIPIAGKDVTKYIADSLRKSVVVDSPESEVALNRLAKQIKEKLAYVCADPAAERRTYEKDFSHYRKVNWSDPKTGQSKECQVGYERFLGPEIFFQPKLAGLACPSLPVLLHDCVKDAPIDYRKALLGNVVLSGGSTMFENFASRTQSELSSLVNVNINVKTAADPQVQRFAVWHGARVLAHNPNFDEVLFTKAQYDEVGPRGARDNTLTKCLGL
jgi:actin-related protein 3